jgi:hypothetical protein
MKGDMNNAGPSDPLGPTWDRVILHRGFSVVGSPMEPRTVHVFQYVYSCDRIFSWV